jgi:hypothetical protein
MQTSYARLAEDGGHQRRPGEAGCWREFSSTDYTVSPSCTVPSLFLICCPTSGDLQAVVNQIPEPSFHPQNPQEIHSQAVCEGIFPIRQSSLEAGQDWERFYRYGLSRRTLSLLKVVHSINVMLEAIFHGDKSEDSLGLLFEACSKLYQDLNPLSRKASQPMLTTKEECIYQSCTIATLMYLEPLLSSTPFWSAANIARLPALRSAVENADPDSSWGPAPEALVWVCLIGSTAARHQAERAWFVARMKALTTAVGNLYFEEVRSAMLLLGWVVYSCERGGLCRSEAGAQVSHRVPIVAGGVV